MCCVLVLNYFKDIEAATGFESCKSWKVDLADFASVTSSTERFHRQCDRLEILVMNAAILTKEYEETIDGWETRSVCYRERRTSVE